MKPINAKHERGVALLALLAVIMLGASWLLVSRLNTESGGLAAVKRARNAEVLNRAKLALIGYVAQRAATSGENNPGRLPCPEALNNIGASDEGIAAPWVGPPATTTCSSIGRLPWRTLGLDKLVDTAGEPLWYVIGPSWRLTNSASTLLINSNTPTGDITVDGQQTVALIVAPGAAMNIQTSAACTARNQMRSAPSPTMDARDYIECFDSATLQFVTTAPSTSFNDQVVRITVADVMPAIEAAIATRIEREIAPALKSVYGDATWGTSSTNPAFPFAAPFADPTTSSYLGQIKPPHIVISLYEGLLPFNYHSSTCPVGDNRCSSDAITWGTPSMSSSGGPGYLTTPTTFPSSVLPICSVSGSTPTCEGYYYGGALNISMTDALTTQIADGLRTFTLATHTATFQPWRWTEPSGPWVNLGTQPATVSRSLASDGTARFVAGASLPSVPTWGYYYIYGSRPTISDHSVLSPTDPTTGWFVRNEWYRLLYYAIAPNHAPGGSLSCSSTGTITCLQVTNLVDPTKQRAVLALAGRSLSALSQTRPSGNLQNYLDSAENRNLDSIFVQSPVNRSFNDRFISISKNP